MEQTMTTIEKHQCTGNTRLTRQPDGLGDGRACRTASPPRPACLRARPPASTRRWNCGTATRSGTAAKACCKAVANVNKVIAPKLKGKSPRAQQEIDDLMSQAGRHGHQGQARRQCHPRRLDGRVPGGGAGRGLAALRAYPEAVRRQGQRALRAAGADDERAQRRRARRPTTWISRSSCSSRLARRRLPRRCATARRPFTR